ncbi:hypothetical protein BGZ63DRAFT_404205 [Mariannaea sp. PMI_226]|nr:hypothetical protein BGZ63DRAFT_404205 [Mariannaea sp. PMI_226]
MASRLAQKKLNSSQTPKSSLGPSLQSISQEHRHNPFNPTASEPAAKRQKVDEDSRELQQRHASRWFTKKKLKPHNDTIEDVFHYERLSNRKAPSQEKQSPEIHDLTQDGSQGDILEITGSHSTGKVSTINVPEFRVAQPGKTVTRQRKSRNPTDARYASVDRLSPGYAPSVATSPDILCENYPDDPPPANVVSDLLSPSRSNAAKFVHTRTRPARRLGKQDEDSEDELASNTANPRKRPNNFSSMTSQKRPQRGDIERSRFFSSKPAATRTQTRFEVSIANAVSGKDIYPLPGQADSEVKLRLLDDVAEVSRDIPWLEIHLSKVLRVFHDATHSPIIIIRRSSTNTTATKLAIRFKTVEEAVQLISWIPGINDLLVVKPEAELEKMFQVTLDEYQKFDHSGNRDLMSPVSSSHAVEDSPRGTASLEVRLRSERRPSTEKLKDMMRGHPNDKPPNVEKTGNASPTNRDRRIETRRSRRLSPAYQFNDPSPYRWTTHNPSWDKNWRMSLEFPAYGKNRESVDKTDVARLDEGEFLNDNLINFYMRYLQAELETKSPETLRKVHFFNTFFFPTIKSGGSNINYRGVAKWTAKINLFSYKYIVVPINESLHWYLAIIYNAPKLLPGTTGQSETDTIDLEQSSTEGKAKTADQDGTNATSLENDPSTADRGQTGQTTNGTLGSPSQAPLNSKSTTKSNKGTSTGGIQKFLLDEPRIITLDSLGSPHSNTCKVLKSYLAEEAKHKKDVELLTLPPGMTAKHIPAQDNSCDCGAFLLGYMEEFLKDPDEAVRRMLQKEDVGWNIDASRIRTKVRNLILTLQKDYQAGEESKREERKKQKRLAKATSLPSHSSPRAPSARNSEAPTPTRGVTSPLSNSIRSPAVAALERVFSTPAEPKPSSSPTKQEASDAPLGDQDSKFVLPLGDDSSLDSKTPFFHSARTSPEGASPIPVDLTTESSTRNAAKDRFVTRLQPKFVQELPSSSPELSPTSRGVKRLRSESIEGVSLVETPPSRPRASKLQPEVLPSIETDKPSNDGSQYDGVDHLHPGEI